MLFLVTVAFRPTKVVEKDHIEQMLEGQGKTALSAVSDLPNTVTKVTMYLLKCPHVEALKQPFHDQKYPRGRQQTESSGWSRRLDVGSYNTLQDVILIKCSIYRMLFF